MNMQRYSLHTVFLLVLYCLSYASHADAQEDPLVLILSTQKSKPYTLACTAFQNHLAESFPGAAFIHHHDSSDNEADLANMIPGLGDRQPSLILTLGTRAAQQANLQFPDTPLVATMILNEDILEPQGNRTGILLTFPPRVQLAWLLKMLPQVKRVGVLYDPEQNSDWLIEAEREAGKLGLDIFGVEIYSVKQLQDRLSIISKNADVLLAIPDRTVYSGRTAKEVLLFSYRNRIPFVGLSSSWVKAGALYALEVDYEHLGLQCAEKAKKIIEGSPAGTIPLSRPDKVTYTINERTRKYLRLEFPPGLIQRASKIFE